VFGLWDGDLVAEVVVSKIVLANYTNHFAIKWL
jgi:hypothetical protein